MDVFPAAQEISALAGTGLIVRFDVPVDTASVNEHTFRVFGRWSGPATGSFSFWDNNEEVRFTVSEPFFAGEWITAQLSKNIKSAAGESMVHGYAWNFWIATAPGTLDQPLMETIELKLPGEDWIQVYGAYAGDMNDDGYTDLVAVNENADDLRILLNDGQGSYPSTFEVYDFNSNSTPSPSEGGDFDNDGEIDVVVTTAWDNEVRVLTGDGQGGFSNQDTYFTSNGVRGVVVGDFDGDGWDDILTTNRLDGNISIFLNDGDGTFTATGMDLPGMDENTCAATDANNDGILDVFFATYSSQQAGILLGDGDGNFTLSAAVQVDGRPWMAGVGDVNGDGNADLVTVNSNGNKTAVLFGDGQGGLGPPMHYAPPNHGFPLAVDLGDLDGDGDLDIVTSNYQSKTYTVFENDGTGFFEASVTLDAPEATSCAILHDRDNDGDLDITGTDEQADVILLFENPGPANSTSEPRGFDFRVRLSPNPVRGQLRVGYLLPKPADVGLVIFDAMGQERWRTTENHQVSGNNFLIIDVNTRLESGIYQVVLCIGTNKIARKFCLIKP